MDGSEWGMAMSVLNDTHECRPYPPLRFIEDHQLTPYIGLVPANEVQEWMQRQIIDDAGSLFNPDHGHLADAVLQHHYPNIPNLGDITKIDWSPYVGAAVRGKPTVRIGNRRGSRT